MKRWVCGSVLVLFVFLALVPIGAVVWRSFVGDDGAVSLVHYAAALGQGDDATSFSQRLDMFTNTALVGLTAVLVTLLLGVPYAFFTARTKMPGRKLFVSLYLLPILMPPLLAGFAWNEIAVLWNRARGLAGPDGIYPTGILGSGLVFGLAYLPFVVLFTRQALRRIPASMEESGRLAVGTRRTIARVTLPLALPGILAGAIFVFIFTSADFTVVDYLNTYNTTQVGGASFRVFPVLAFNRWKLGQHGEAEALGLILALVTIAALYLVMRLRRKRDVVTVSASWRTPERFELGRAKWLATIWCGLALALSFGIPVTMLAIRAGGIDAFREAVSDAKGDIIQSLTYGLAGATIAVLLAWFLAWMTARAKRRTAGGLEMAALLPLAVPPILLGFGLLTVWTDPPFSGDGWRRTWNAIRNGTWIGDTRVVIPIILFTLVVKYLPFPYTAIVGNLRSLDPGLEDAAAVAGVPWAKRQRRILAPLCAPGIASGWVLAFVFTLREIDTLAIISGTNSIMFRIYSWIHLEQGARVAALCLILMAMMGLPFLIYTLVSGRKMSVV